MMSTQVETVRVSVKEAVTHEVNGTPFGQGIRDGMRAEIRTESRVTRGRYSDVTGTLQLPIERAVITARP
jgi:hypothetical protein